LIYVVFYSMYGHVYTLAKTVAKAVEASGVADVKLFQVKETLPQDVLEKMYAPAKPDVPILDPNDLVHADGVLFGVASRYGQASAQFKCFWDATGQLWAKGALSGKPAGVFFSTATQGGGQETIAMTFLTHLVHHGMIFVPLGYANKNMFNVDEVHGGSPWGAGTFAGGQGQRQPTALELEVAETQGKNFAAITAKLHKGGQ